MEFTPIKWKDVVREFKIPKSEYKLFQKPLTRGYDRIPQTQSFDSLKNIDYNLKILDYKTKKDLEYPTLSPFHGSYGGADGYQSSMPKASTSNYSVN